MSNAIDRLSAGRGQASHGQPLPSAYARATRKGFFGFDAEFIDCVFTGRAESMVFHGSPDDGLEDVQTLVEGVAELLDPVERAALKARVDRASRATGQDSLDRSLNEFRGNDFRDMELVDVGFAVGSTSESSSCRMTTITCWSPTLAPPLWEPASESGSGTTRGTASTPSPS